MLIVLDKDSCLAQCSLAFKLCIEYCLLHPVKRSK